jgi:4-amino-4-deoxy-L-arabinose transferase-like glycosyltransferase
MPPSTPTANPPDHSLPVANRHALAVLTLHILTNLVTPYGFHRDEFLYFAMGEHLRLWRMDFPPFIAIVARASRALFDTSLPGLRLAPAFSHALLTGLSAWAAWVFGGRRSAQALTALAVATSPLFMRSGAMFQPVTFDQLWWTLVLASLVMRIRDDDAKHWLGIGLFFGLGALTKFSIAFLAAGVLVALLATPLRRDLRTRWPWLGLLIAIAVGHPSITGQIALGWPVRQQMADLQSTQLTRVGPLAFLSGQSAAGPIILLAALGAFWMFAPGRLLTGAATGKGAMSRAHLYGSGARGLDWRMLDWRPIAIACGVPFLLLLALHGKAYYIGPLYPTLAAAGAVALDALGERIAPKRPTKLLALGAAVIALFGVAMLPFGLPLLEPTVMAQYAAIAAPRGAVTTNMGEELRLPQDYADMLGWEQMVEAVARVWRTLPPSDTAQAVLLATNYGRAGALDLLGRSRGLPAAISPAGSYWFFGPGDRTGNVAVVVGEDAAALKPFFADVTEVAHTNNFWGVPEERSVRVFVCRQPLHSLKEVWPMLAGRN